MTNEKYELTKEWTRERDSVLYRIRALKDFGDVKAGDVGGWVESKRNLSTDINDEAWVYDDAKVFENAVVRKGSKIKDSAEVFENADIKGSLITDSAKVHGSARVEDSTVKKYAKVKDNAKLDTCLLTDRAEVKGNASISYTNMYFSSSVGENSIVKYSIISGCSRVYGNADLVFVNLDDSLSKENLDDPFCDISGNTTIRGYSENGLPNINLRGVILARNVSITSNGYTDIEDTLIDAESYDLQINDVNPTIKNMRLSGDKYFTIDKNTPNIEALLKGEYNNKFELTNETMEYNGHTLHRIRALNDLGYYSKDGHREYSVKKGDLGGWVESGKNLCCSDRSWVYDDSKVYQDAIVEENSTVNHGSEISGSARIRDHSSIEHSNISGNAQISYSAVLESKVMDDASLSNTRLGKSLVDGSPAMNSVFANHDCHIGGHAYVESVHMINSNVIENASVEGGNSPISEHGLLNIENTTLMGNANCSVSYEQKDDSEYRSCIKNSELKENTTVEINAPFKIENMDLSKDDSISVKPIGNNITVLKENGTEHFFEREDINDIFFGTLGYEQKEIPEEMILLDDKYAEVREFLDSQKEDQDISIETINRNNQGFVPEEI